MTVTGPLPQEAKPIFQGRVALVTGGGSGIGRGVSNGLAQAGAHVIIVGRDSAAGEEAIRTISSQGGSAEFLRGDISDARQVDSVFRQIRQSHGRLDLAFNNAGVARGGSVSSLTEEDFDFCFGVNTKGLWLCMRAELALMGEHGGGSIVNNTSVHGFRTVFPGVAAYVASKHAAVALTRIAALENAASGIRVNGIAPGPIDTEMLRASDSTVGGVTAWERLIPAGRIGQVDEVTPLVKWLLSDDATYVNGQVVGVDGGFLAS